MGNSKSKRPDLKQFISPTEYSLADEELELNLYNAMYSNRKNMRLTKELSDDITAEIEKIINDRPDA